MLGFRLSTGKVDGVTEQGERAERPNSVLGRAFTLVAALGASEAGLTLSELCRRTGIPKGTAHRLLAELIEWDVVERSGGGLRLRWQPRRSAPPPEDLRGLAAPYLTDLHEATGETVQFAVLDTGGVPEVVYLHRLRAEAGPVLPARIGGRMPAYCTGLGKAMLAFSPPQTLLRVLDAGLRRRAPRTVIVPRLLQQQLAVVRQRGVADEYEESAPGLCCVAAPVLIGDGTVVAAVSITGSVRRMDPARHVSAIRTTALGLSRALS
ncbi:IclR family transcriptional regulator [Mycolicibacterium sp. CH28]|nr:IclR family transcriptional regulator [Mycolicibacterium sp. CH28]